MAFYSYIAYTKNKRKVTGTVEANSKLEAKEKVRSLGYKPIQVAISKNAAKDNKMRPLSLKEKIEFTQTFKTLNQAGVPIVESLMFLGNDGSTANIRAMCKTLRQEILQGSTFAGAVAKHPNVFDKVYIGLCKAGEDSGEMDKTLGRLAELLLKQSQIKSKVTSAMMYPVFVITLALLIVTVMIVFVFPKFKDMFEQTGRSLPPITQACIDLGDFMRAYWYICIIGVIVFCFLVYKAFTVEKSKKIIDKYLLMIPVIKDLILKSNFSNFLTILLVAYEAGIPILNCLHLSVMALTNHVLKTGMAKTASAVQEGVNLSSALKSTGLVPKMIVFMISTGEQSGRLGDLLENVVDFIDKELDKIVGIMTQMMEPLMLVIIGGIVLFMALAFYLPLFNLSGG